jgi:hypothetical protein
LGSRRHFHHRCLERCSGSSEAHSQGVAEDPEAAAAVDVKAAVHWAPSLFVGYQSCLAVGVAGLGVAASDAGWMGVTSTD